jgi:hypothetical protein
MDTYYVIDGYRIIGVYRSKFAFDNAKEYLQNRKEVHPDHEYKLVKLIEK